MIVEFSCTAPVFKMWTQALTEWRVHHFIICLCATGIGLHLQVPATITLFDTDGAQPN